MIIRIAEKKDVIGILAIYAPFILETATTFEIVVPSEADFWQRIQNTLKNAPWLVCEIDGTIAGYAYASLHRKRSAYQWTREISTYVNPAFRRRKVASTLYAKLIKILELQGCKTLLAGVTEPNVASVRLHESFGFELLGTYEQVGYKFGEFRDVSWLQMPIGTNEPPADIVSWRIVWKELS